MAAPVVRFRIDLRRIPSLDRGKSVFLKPFGIPVLLLKGRQECLTQNCAKSFIRIFFNLAPIEPQLPGYDACLLCLGGSSVGMSQEEYKHITYDLTLNVAQLLAKCNRDITFCYVTGAGTDSSEHGRIAWARVKGATENALMRLFKRSYMFRPGFMKPTPGQKNVKSYYQWLAWVYPVGRTLYPAGFCTLQEVGWAMINAVIKGYPQPILEVKDIVQLARV